MIKYYGVYPPGFDINNLHEVQKMFLIYLAGVVPKEDEWSLNVSYFKEKSDIEELDSIEIEQTDIDLAGLQGQSIEDLRCERLSAYKTKCLKDLDMKFGLKKDDKKEAYDISSKINGTIQQKLYDMISNKPVSEKEEDGL